MLGALAVLVALVTATAVAAAGYVERRSGEIASASLEGATAAGGALVVQTRLEQDPAAQAAAWEAVLLAHTPGEALTTVRLVITDPLTLAVDGRGDDAGSRTSLAAADWLPEHADLVSGTWPEAAGAVDAGRLAAVVPHASAQELGVDVGDVLLLGRSQDTAVEIVGTFEPREPGAPRWVGFGSVDLSGSAASFGPVLVPADALAGVGGDPFVRWSLVPSGDPLTVAELDPLADGLAGLVAAVDDDDAIAPRGTTSIGDLAVTVGGLRDAAGAAAVVGNVALVLLVVLGTATLAQVARLVAQSRAGETAILVARGASRGWLAALGWGEAAVVAVAGTGLSLAVGLALGGAPAPLVSVGAAVAATLAVGLPWWSSARAISRGVRIDASGRSRSLATVGGALLLVLAAGLSLWRFTGAGTGETARTPLDEAIAVGAPGLVALALGVVALVVLTPVWGALERLAAGTRRIAPRFALVQVARRRAVLGVPLLLVVVAVATATLGSGYTATTQTAQTRLSDTRVGADARLELPASSAVSGQRPPRSTADVLAIDGVLDAAPVARVQARSGEQDLVLEAIAAPAIGGVVRGGTTPAGALAASLAPEAPAPAVPAGGVSISIVPTQGEGSFDGEITALSASGTVWLADERGQLARVDLTGGALSLATPGWLTGEVPDGDWRLLAVDVAATGATSGWESTLEVTILEVAVDGVVLAGEDQAWAGAAWPVAGTAEGGTAATNPTSGATAAARFQGTATVRFVPDPLTAAPAAVTRALADRLDLSLGETLTVAYRGGTVDLEVATVADLVPGVLDEPAALVDLTALQRSEVLVRRTVADTAEVWVALEPGAADADPLAGLAALARAESGTLTTTAATGTGTAVAQPVFRAVGLVAILLALVGALAAFDVLTRERRGEVIALRAVGVPGRVQARSRSQEALLLGAVAIPTGLVVGWVVALLTVPTLVRLSVPGIAALAQPLVLSPGELALALALALGGIAAVGALVGRRVRREHADTDHREETR